METGDLLIQLQTIERQLQGFTHSHLNNLELQKITLGLASFKKQLQEQLPRIHQESPADSGVDQEASAARLVANVSHEIRTPLNGIVGFIDLLNETKLNETQSEIVNALRSASNGLMNIINELLEYSKLRAGQEKFEKHPFNLKNLIEELRFLSETLIIDRNIKFLIDVSDNVPDILVGDPSKLSQILLNLLGNAIKFVDSGQITLKVVLKNKIENRLNLEFEVADTGIGISEENLEKIFETYHQVTPENETYHGTGLGLTIVKQLIEKMGGAISVKSELGVGTTFIFHLPFETEAERTIKANVTNFRNDITIDLNGKNILVFEDNTLNQKLLQSQLESWGCKVTIVANGYEGLKLLEQDSCDLILMDLRMPILNGFEVSRKIRQHHNLKTKNIPIIAISADITAEDKDECAAVGIQDFVLKPYDSKELRFKIGESLGTNNNLRDTNNTTIENSSIDLNPLFQECMGQFELLDELVRLFKNNILEFVGEVKVHLQSRNYQGIDFAAHKVKSCLGMIKARELSNIASQLSDISKNKEDFNELNQLFEKFITIYPKTEEELDNKLNKLKQSA